MTNPKQKPVLLLALAGMVLLSCFSLSASAAVRFIVTGDTRGGDNGVNTTILGEIADATIAEGADFILITGDLVNGSGDQATLESQLTTWRNTMQDVYDTGIGVYPCRGNHDTGSKAAWDNVFTGAYALPNNGPVDEENITFSFTQDNVFIVGLDQYVTDARVNQTWLDAQFTANDEPHVFVFGHEPAFSVHHSDCLDDYPSDRNTFWNSIAAEGGRTYFAGHDHFYNHTRLDDGDADPDDDLHQYILGSGGAPLYDWDYNYGGNNGSWTPQLVHHEKEYGYVLVEVDGSNVTLTWKHREPPGVYVINGDTFTYSTGGVPSSFTAYNDMAWASGQLEGNITKITSPNGGSSDPNTGELIDFTTGTGTGITLTVVGGDFDGDSGGQGGHGGEPDSGTDAHDIFNGKVSSLGAISYQNVAPPTGNLVLTLTGMDSNETYDLSYYANRGSYGWDRASLVTISSADAFTNSSSAATDNPTGTSGTLFDGPTDASTRLPADNGTRGYVAYFADVNSGSDGEVVLTISYDGTGGTHLYKGKYASALMVEKLGPPQPAPASFKAYVDLNSQSGDNNHGNVLAIEPPPDPCEGLVLIDYATGSDLPVTMDLDMLYSSYTSNGGDSAGGTDADDIFGGIVDGVGGYEMVSTSGHYVTVTFNNLEADAEYEVSLTYNRNRTPPYTDRASKITISDANTYTNASSSGVIVNGANSVSFVSGDNDANGYVAKWTGITDADGSFSVTTVQDTTHGWTGSKGYAMTSILLEKVEPEIVPASFKAYVDLRAQSGDNNHSNVLQIEPALPDTQPIDPATDWVLKDYDTGANLPVTMDVNMQVQYPTYNGGDSAGGTDADDIFGGIVDGVGGYEIVDGSGDYVTVTFSNLEADAEYEVSLTHNRNKIPPYTDRASKITISDANTYTNASSSGVVVNSPNSVSFVSGDNTTNGYVAKWTGVTDTDGSFSVTTVQDTAWLGSKGYAMTSILLEKVELIAEPNEWVAYNDSQPQDSTNDANFVTEHDYTASDAVLKDHSTGNDLSATVTGITVNGYDPVTTGGPVTNASSDAYQMFNGIVDLDGNAELDVANWDNIIEFNDLDPNMEYTITLTANRAEAGYANQRYTKVTIEGADTYANASSSGVVVNGPNSVSFCTGYNTINGYVAKWTSVTTGPDGSFSIKSEYDDSQTGTKGYAMSAFKLEQSLPEPEATLPILVGDAWKYLQGTSEPPANWADPNFDDSSWLSGPTGIGYADGDDATVLGDMQNSYISVYARKDFNVPEPNMVYRLLFSMDYDDGFVAYLNGTEIARANVTGNPPAYDVNATTDHEASGGTNGSPVEYFDVNEALLQAGKNVLAVQGHNKSLSSSDFSLIPALETTVYDWIAYADLNWQSPDPNDNILALVPTQFGEGWTPPLLDPCDGLVLIDYDTGVAVPVTMSIDLDVRYATDNGADSAPGTDADLVFGDIVGSIGGYELDGPNFVTVTFDNLNPDKKYFVAVTYNRNGGGDYTNRATEFTLSGADDYTEASSDGVVVNSPNSVSFSTGNNTANGYITKWTGVTAGDGSFSITAEHDAGFGGTKGYAMTSIMLQQFILDSDGDAVPNDSDNCPATYNPDQNDVDGDGVGNLCDNCPDVNNPNQANSDTDTFGDLCDNCPDVNNPGQTNSDTDSFGDLCDNCPDVNNPDQTNSDVDSFGDLCDNCPDVNNPDQDDTDTDGIGDECECEQANLNDAVDWLVDFTDYAILAENWLGTAAVADTNWDGIVDMHDLAQLCEHWLELCVHGGSSKEY